MSDNEEQDLLIGPDPNYDGLYTYADYYQWTVEERLELIKGKVFQLPTPHTLHQLVSGRICVQLWNFLKINSLEVFCAPFDVRLPNGSRADEDVITVVQPDIAVCKPENLDVRGGIGPPAIAIEILSPGNNAKELRDKFYAYEDSGIKEYWIIFPSHQSLIIYKLDNGKYTASRPLTNGDVATSPILPGFELALDEVFKEL